MTGGNTNHYTTADLSSGFGAPRWPLFVLPGRPPRPRTQRARNAKTTKSKNKHKKANSEKSPSGAQSPAFRGVRPEMRRSPGGQGQAKNSTKKTTKNKQSPKKQGEKKIAGGAQTPAFQRVRPEMRRSPGTRKARKSKNEKSKNSTVEPKSFCGFFGLCLRQLLALRASPPAAWGHTTGSASFRWSLRLGLAAVPRGVRQTLKKAGRHAWGWSPDKLRMPGDEPGSQAWEACMMPLHYMRFCKRGPEQSMTWHKLLRTSCSL